MAGPEIGRRRRGWALPVVLIVVLLVGAFLVWRFFIRENPAVIEPPAAAVAAPPPAQATTRGVSPPAAVERESGPALPSEPPAVHSDVRRLVDLVKRRNPTAANRRSGASIVVCGASGARYDLYYNGDAQSRADRGIMIRDLPTDADAHDPDSSTSRNALTLWDMGLDGSLDQGSSGSPWAPTPFELRTLYQRSELGVPHGAAHERELQTRYEQKRRDILSGPSCPR